uniref:Uncharacterized protein n=2 Tax=Caenorhabditis japonica TaxID=281687 RepID=A0A8R1HPC0_CAEJA
MKVFALGLDENQKADRAAEDVKESKIPIESVAASVPHQSPAIFLAKPPKRPFHGFTCGILSWFIGACCLVLLCLAISEVAYHRQRDQAFLRLKWAELRQRMLGYELLSQQQELDRLALEKQKQVEALPLRRSDDPIKPKIVDIIQPQDDAVNNNKVSSSVSSSSEESGVKPVFSQYASEQNEKFGFLQALIDKIRKHAQSMGLNGDMQVHVVEVNPLFTGNKGDSSNEENASMEKSLADGFGEYAMPRQTFEPVNDAYENNDRITFDRHGMRRPFGPFNRNEVSFYDDLPYDDTPFNQQPFNQWNAPPPFQQQPSTWWGPRQPQQQQQQQPFEVQTNVWNDQNGQNRPFFNGLPPVPVVQFQQQQQQQQQQQPQMPMQMQMQQPAQQPWYQPYNDNNNNNNNQNVQNVQTHQNNDWPFQPNPAASQWNEQAVKQNNDFNAHMDVISDDTANTSNQQERVKAWVQPAEEQENVISPDPTLETINDGKFLPIRSDDTPIDSDDSHLFQVDDPSSFKR